MSLWGRLLGLVFLPAFLMLGCERDDLEIGLPPRDNVYDLGYFEYTVTPLLTQEDSIVNMTSGRLLLGSYDDPTFGQISTTAYTTIDATTITPPPADIGAEADSLVLTMKIDYLYGDQDMLLDLDIWTLPLPLQDTILYKSDDPQSLLAPFSEKIGTVLYTVPVSTYNNDSTIYVRTKLDIDFANKLLDSLEVSTALFEFDGFKDILKGIGIEPNAGNDGIVGIDVDNDETRLTLYYTDIGQEQEVWQMKFNDLEHYNYITPNGADFSRPGTAFETLVTAHTDFDPMDNYTYFQSGTGLGITFEMDDLFGLADTLDNTVINTAILEIENIEALGDVDLPPVMRIFLTDDSNEPQFHNGNILRTIYQGSRSDTIDINSATFRRGAVEEFLKYDANLNEYQADITLYVQAFLEGRVDLSKLWLSDPRVPVNVSGWRVANDQIKLKVYYTKPGN